MQRVRLHVGVEDRTSAWLKPLTGAAEIAGADDATALLALCLAGDAAGLLRPEDAPRLPMVDRDRLLAGIYRGAFGDRVEADGRCGACGGAYTMSFGLAVLAESVQPDPDGPARGPDADGRYQLDDVVFRLPTARDIADAAAADDPAAALLAACVVAGDAVGRAAEIEAAMAAAGPTLDLDLDTTCPDCGAAQTPRFRIDAFLTQRLQQERPLLRREIHAIATAYGWSQASILDLTREDRQGYVGLILERPSSATPLDAQAAPGARRAFG